MTVRPPAGIEALLFDLDGTLLDTDPLHSAVYRELFAAHGIEIDQDFYLAQLHGRLNADIFADHFPGEDATSLSERKEAAFRDRLGGDVPPMPGLAGFLDRPDVAMLPKAVVTNAPRQNAHAMLAAIGMADRFDTLVIGDECARGKPDPEPYLVAMRQLGAAPEACVAFEDSASGLESAAGAGAWCIGLASSLDADALSAAGARQVIADFTDVSLPDLTQARKASA